MNLRPYQKTAVSKIFEAWENYKRTLLVLPTGCGKTIVFANIAAELSKRERVLILAHRDELIRQAADKLQQAISGKDRSYKPQNDTSELEKIARNEYPAATQYNYNIANSEARQLYRNEGTTIDTPAFELQKPQRPQIMQCRHCLRRALGHCLRHGGTPPQWREPLRLRMDDGRTFSVEFDCKQCQMNIYAD